MDKANTSETIDHHRRRLIATAPVTFAAIGLGALGKAQAALMSFGPLKQINAGMLNVSYAEAGPANGPPVILLHGWPYDIHTKAELQWWYQYYFATERGREGYKKYRHDFARLIWQIASPKWNFDDATFERSAASLDNPDHVAIVVDNYRWRLGLVEGEPQYDDLEQKLAQAPVISVPTITLEGDANGAPHPEPHAYAKMFSGKYAHRLIAGGIGHNLPQEAPQAFAQAVIDVDGL